jgi:phytanoyl-CoA hydroxylase
MVWRGSFNEKSGFPAAASAAFRRDGVAVIEDFVPVTQCEALRQRALELVEEVGPSSPATVFSTLDNRHARDRYFEESARGIGAFFEEGAFDSGGQLQVPLSRAINKLGHAMHDLDPVFKAFSHGGRLQRVAEAVGLIDPLLMQSMYIFKQPGIGGEVACHQDSTFLYTEPESVVGFWFAIEDAYRGNGCLGGLAGEHVKGLRDRYCRGPDGSLQMQRVRPDIEWDLSALEWLEVKQGALVVFNGTFPHLSEANTSPQSRHAYTLHAVSRSATYPPDNWLQRPASASMPFRGFV